MTARPSTGELQSGCDIERRSPMRVSVRRSHLPQVGERTVDELLKRDRQVGLGRALELIAGRERTLVRWKNRPPL